MTWGWAAVSQDTNPSTALTVKGRLIHLTHENGKKWQAPGGVKMLILHRFERELAFRIDKELLKADSGEADE